MFRVVFATALGILTKHHRAHQDEYYLRGEQLDYEQRKAIGACESEEYECPGWNRKFLGKKFAYDYDGHGIQRQDDAEEEHRIVETVTLEGFSYEYQTQGYEYEDCCDYHVDIPT